MIDLDTARAEAALLDQAEQGASQIRQTTSVYPDLTIDEAYSIQAAWLTRKLERGETVVGHKIGLTSRAMQAAMNITTPDSGFLTDKMVFEPDSQLVAADFCDPKVEIELAFVLATDLAGSELTIDDVLDATDHVVPAVELIAARSFRKDPETGRTRTVVDTVADNAADAGIVMGGERVGPRDVDLRWLSALGSRNGVIEETGVAAGVLGHPAEGIVWLARRYHEQGMTLEAGQIILAGSFTRPIDIRPGDDFHFDYGPLGAFGLRFRVMHMPRNEFKRRLGEPGVQYGMWVSLADPVAAEISAGAGFDWLMIDAEHSPNDLRTLLVQLQAVSAYPVSAVVRPPVGDAVIIKQYLDLGAQTILVPMVETAEQAQALVRAMRYPPHGVRGVASGRGSRWGRVENFWRQANDETCLLVQVETIRGVSNLMDIARVDGVDGVFIGPSDLGAALGHLGDATHPEVRAAVTESIAAVRAAGKPAGVLSVNPTLAREFRDTGATFVAVGVDTNLLAKHTTALAESSREEDEAS